MGARSSHEMKNRGSQPVFDVNYPPLLSPVRSVHKLCGHKGGELPDTVADGLRINLSDKTWPIVRDDVDEIVTVPEEEIKHWMRVIYERMKLVIEPSAAVGVAVLMSPTVRNRCFNTDGTPPRIGIVLCGGNVDVSKLQMLLVGED